MPAKSPEALQRKRERARERTRERRALDPSYAQTKNESLKQQARERDKQRRQLREQEYQKRALEEAWRNGTRNTFTQ